MDTICHQKGNDATSDADGIFVFCFFLLSNVTYSAIIITKNGYGDLVVMGIEAYEKMIGTAQADAAISKAESEYTAEGVLLDAREALSSFRREHFG